MIRESIVIGFLLLAAIFMGIDSEVQAIEEDAVEKVLRVQRVLAATTPPDERAPPVMRLQTDPIKPPRCPRINADGARLLHGFAVQADGGEWIHECRYGVRAGIEIQRRKA